MGVRPARPVSNARKCFREHRASSTPLFPHPWILIFFVGLSITLLCASASGSGSVSGPDPRDASSVRTMVEFPGNLFPGDWVLAPAGFPRGSTTGYFQNQARQAPLTPGPDSPSELGPAFGISIGMASCTRSYVAESYEEILPAMAFDGMNYLVVWMDRRSGAYDIYGTRVDKNGAPLDTAAIAISVASYDQYLPSVAFDGTNYLVVWEDWRSGTNWDVYGARVDTAGHVLDPEGIVISDASSHQWAPDVAFDGTNYLVVWADGRISGTEPTADVYGTFVDKSGNVLNPDGIVIAQKPQMQAAVAVEFADTTYLVVWQDTRNGNTDIYGARVNESGTVLDTAGIPICTAVREQVRPDVASNGTDWMVAWQDTRNDERYPDIYAARVSANGAVLDPGGIAIAVVTINQTLPAIAYGEADYLVVWQDTRSFVEDIYGARVSTSGNVLDPNGFAVCADAGRQVNPALSYDGENFFVVWEDYRNDSGGDIIGTHLNSSGQIVATDCPGDDKTWAAVASDGTNFLTVWSEYSGTSFDICGARVNSSGVVLDATRIVISDASDSQYYPAVTFDGVNYLVVWQDYRSGNNWDLYGARVDTAGNVLDPGGIAISTAPNYQLTPSLVSNGNGSLVVWSDSRSGFSNIYGARVTSDGVVLDPEGIQVSSASNEQYWPCVAFDGTAYAVAWADLRNGADYDIFASRVDLSGNVLDPEGIAVSTASNEQYVPSICRAGENYFVVWADKRNANWDIYGAQMNAEGVVLDPGGIAISLAANDQYWPAAASDEDDCLVVWEDDRNGSPGWDVYGARIAASGAVLDTLGFPISAGEGYQQYPALAEGEPGWLLIAYQSLTSVTPHSVYQIYGNVWAGDIVDIPTESVPGAFMLRQSYPNPSRHMCTIHFELPEDSPVSLLIFDVTGALVRKLATDTRTRGSYREVWDGRRDDGREVPSGIYFCRLEAARSSAVRKMVLFR